MATPSSNNDLWQLDSYCASLSASQVTASVNLLNPSQGLTQLVYNKRSIAGFALGVTPGPNKFVAKNEVSDVFVRGNDLVVTYAETEERPFVLQAYWRVTVGEQGIVVIDSILSLQTHLLESFPELIVNTNLPAAESWLLPLSSLPAVQLVDSQEPITELPLEQPNGVFLKSTDGTWNYAEAPHPEDRGSSQISTGDSAVLLSNKLGGRFLEKGVIRRIRVRGAFLPSDGDFELAKKCLTSLKTEQPPLTV